MTTSVRTPPSCAPSTRRRSSWCPTSSVWGLSAIIGGLLINADNQVLKADEHTPIDGLFAVGNVSGCFYGGVDYPMDVLGLSIGRAITGGYLAGKHVASL